MMVPELPIRKPDDHKGAFGNGLIVGGSRGMSGAAALAAMACLKSGVGRLKTAVPIETLPIVAGFDPSYMTVGLSNDQDGLIDVDAKDSLKENIDWATAVGIGPGLGKSEDLLELVAWSYSRFSKPMVFDADALNLLAMNQVILSQPGGPRILTPHPGELRRLLGDEISSDDELPYRAEILARETGTIIVLKGHQSLITTGKERVHNTTGNVGMATGGSGDVLTGIITALLCQRMEPYDAAVLGCFVHGLAGDAGAKQIGEVSLTATDIVEFIPKAIRAIQRRAKRKQANTEEME